MMNLFIVGRLFLCSRDQGRRNAFLLGGSSAVEAYFNKAAAVQGQRWQSPNKKDIRLTADIFPT